MVAFVKKDPAFMSPVIVVWEDAHHEATEQFETIELALVNHKPMLRKSIGYFITRTESIVLLATDDDREETRPTSFAGVMYFPVGMVRSIEPVCPPITRKRKR